MSKFALQTIKKNMKNPKAFMKTLPDGTWLKSMIWTEHPEADLAIIMSEDDLLAVGTIAILEASEPRYLGACHWGVKKPVEGQCAVVVYSNVHRELTEYFFGLVRAYVDEANEQPQSSAMQ